MKMAARGTSLITVIAIFLSNCIQKIQLARQCNEHIDTAELDFLEAARSILVDTAYVIEGRISLAAGILRMWKQFYDDVWVWGGKRKTSPIYFVVCTYLSQLHPGLRAYLRNWHARMTHNSAQPVKLI